MDVTLFDLDADPGETRDLAGDYPDVVERLLALVDAARVDIGDALTETVGVNARPAGFVDEPWSEQAGSEQ